MNLLELDFLFGVRFQLNVTFSTYNDYCSSLQREMVTRTMYSPLLVPSFLVRSFHKNLLMHLYDEDSQSIHRNSQVTTAVWYIRNIRSCYDMCYIWNPFKGYIHMLQLLWEFQIDIRFYKYISIVQWHFMEIQWFVTDFNKDAFFLIFEVVNEHLYWLETFQHHMLNWKHNGCKHYNVEVNWA